MTTTADYGREAFDFIETLEHLAETSAVLDAAKLTQVPVVRKFRHVA